MRGLGRRPRPAQLPRPAGPCTPPAAHPPRCRRWHTRLCGIMFTNIGHMAPCVPPLCPKCVSPSGLPGSRPTCLQRAEKSVKRGPPPAIPPGVLPHAAPHGPPRMCGAYRHTLIHTCACVGRPGPACGVSLLAQGAPPNVGFNATGIAGGAGGGERPCADNIV